MEGYLIGYELSGGVNYRIYHPETKEFKVLRDVLFDEGEFFSARHVTGYSDEILPSAEINTEDQEAEHEEEVEQQNENAAPIVYDEIIVEPPSNTVLHHGTSAEPTATPPKCPNRHT